MYFSKYHTIINVCEKTFLYNTFNSSLIELDNIGWNEYRLLMQGKYEEVSPDSLDLLESQEFLLINEEQDSYRSKLIHDHYLLSKSMNSEAVKIDIGITNHCNFSCSYCFERNNKDSKVFLNNIPSMYFKHLSSKIKEYVIEQLSLGTKAITVTWYGGEPSLEWNFILNINKKLAKICHENQCDYSNIVVTNGYYLPESVLKNVSNQYFQYIQITLDGPKSYHNNRRNINSITDSYTMILDNIMRLLSAGVEVVIRINIDKDNSEKVKTLLNELANSFPQKEIGKRLFVSFGRVFGTDKSYNLEEYEDIYREIFMQAVRLNFVTPSIDVSLLTAFCSAESVNNNIVFDYTGNVYCCWNDIFTIEKKVGNIYDINFQEKRAMLSTRYYDDLSLEHVNNGQCLNCELVNFCQGLCPYDRLQIREAVIDNIYKNGTCKKIIKKGWLRR